MTQLLSEDQIESKLAPLDWTRDGDRIMRDRKLADFTAAIAFVNRVAEVAEAANHHPDIFVHAYNKVSLTLTNHSAGGLTEVDFELAVKFDALA